MARELKCSNKGNHGAQKITITDVYRDPQSKKMKRAKFGQLIVQKCSIQWYDTRSTENNRFCIDWDLFVEFMKKYPAR